MMLDTAAWHDRFVQQASWTKAMRQHLYTQIGLTVDQRILEVGCGTGAILADFDPAASVGIDTNFERLEWISDKQVQCADGHNLPYANNSFDITVGHFLLLWVANPALVIQEMQRVTRPGGFVLALAEPDYGGRIDYPEELAQLGQWQQEALAKQGADPLMGRKLAGLFVVSGLKNIETGLMGGQWQPSNYVPSRQGEFDIVNHDLRGSIEESQLEELRKLDTAAWENGERVLFVPTFYALGQVE
ncbi:MAG: methyltransferase domain-containing protein [Chloroflexi bacterium]|nr:methyltransferase domain-containing protein [Chloroflexota bacterium]